MNNTKKIVYAFIQLPYHEKMRCAKTLDVFSDDLYELTSNNSDKEIFKRIKSQNKIEALIEFLGLKKLPPENKEPVCSTCGKPYGAKDTEFCSNSFHLPENSTEEFKVGQMATKGGYLKGKDGKYYTPGITKILHVPEAYTNKDNSELAQYPKLTATDNTMNITEKLKSTLIDDLLKCSDPDKPYLSTPEKSFTRRQEHAYTVAGNKIQELQAAIDKKIDSVIVMWDDPSNEMDGVHTLKTLRHEIREILTLKKQ